VAALRQMLARDPTLYRVEYWYTQPIDLAVREGHAEAVRVLLEAGADPGRATLGGESLATMARDRGHVEAVRLLDEAASRGGRPPASAATADHEIHGAADAGDTSRVRAILDAEPSLVHRRDRAGGTPLRRAVTAGAREVVSLLLERGADPNAAEGAMAPRGSALHAAARTGDLYLVELLLAHGADPNGAIDSAGSATFAARTPEIRALLMARGGTLDAYDLVWLGDEDEAVRRVRADPRAANAGCGGVLAAACARGRPDLLVRLLDAGARVPPVLTECRSYLLEDPAMLRLLLASGMDPDLPTGSEPPPSTICAAATAGDARGPTGPIARRSSWKPGPRSRPETRATGRRRSPGRRAATCRTWSSCCSRAERRSAFRTTRPGPRPWPGRFVAAMTAPRTC
jgi:hypothetical protein